MVKNEELTYNSASTKNRLFIIDILCAMYNAGNGVLNNLREQLTIDYDETMRNVKVSRSIDNSRLNIFALKTTEIVFSTNILKLIIILITVTVLIGLVLICILTDSLKVNTKILWYHKKRIKHLRSSEIVSSSIDAITITSTNITTTTITNTTTTNNNYYYDKIVNVCHYNRLPVNFNFKRKNIINSCNDKRIKSR